MMRALLVAFVRGYQIFIGSWLRSSCRFHPSCSGYAIEAIQRHGAGAGAYLAAARIVRCGPWCQGGDDPVPADKPRLFTHFSSFSQKKNS